MLAHFSSTGALKRLRTCRIINPNKFSHEFNVLFMESGIDNKVTLFATGHRLKDTQTNIKIC